MQHVGRARPRTCSLEPTRQLFRAEYLPGRILDGRNRYLACQQLEIEPRFAEWAGEGDPTVWVLSEDLHRRHLTASQRAAIAVAALPMIKVEVAKHKSEAVADANRRRSGSDESSVVELIPQPSPDVKSRELAAQSGRCQRSLCGQGP